MFRLSNPFLVGALSALVVTSGCTPALRRENSEAVEFWGQVLVLMGGGYVVKNSPAAYGFDARMAPGFKLGNGDARIHPTIGYSRSLFGGVEGEQDNYLHLGTQVRSASVTESGAWLGGEAMYSRRWTSFDSPGIENETTNGWTLAGMAGIPLGSALGAYVTGGVNKYGGSGPYVRLGFEWRP